MQFARLQNNRVREIFEATNLAQFKKIMSPEIVAMCIEVPADQTPVEGQVWNDPIFEDYVPPAPTQDDLNSDYKSNAENMERELLKLALKWIDSKLDVQNPEDVIFREKFNELKAERDKIIEP